MASWRYLGHDVRTFHGPPALQVEPGEVVEARKCPDEHWFERVKESSGANKGSDESGEH